MHFLFSILKQLMNENLTSCSSDGLNQVHNTLKTFFKLKVGFDSLKQSFPWIPHLNFVWSDLCKWRIALMSISPYNPINFHNSTLNRECTERAMQYRCPVKYFHVTVAGVCRILHWVISVVAPTMSSDGRGWHQVIPYWEGPCKAEERWEVRPGHRTSNNSLGKFCP